MDDTRGGAFGTGDGTGLELIGFVFNGRFFNFLTEQFDLFSLFS